MASVKWKLILSTFFLCFLACKASAITYELHIGDTHRNPIEGAFIGQVESEDEYHIQIPSRTATFSNPRGVAHIQSNDAHEITVLVRKHGFKDKFVNVFEGVYNTIYLERLNFIPICEEECLNINIENFENPNVFVVSNVVKQTVPGEILFYNIEGRGTNFLQPVGLEDKDYIFNFNIAKESLLKFSITNLAFKTNEGNFATIFVATGSEPLSSDGEFPLVNGSYSFKNFDYYVYFKEDSYIYFYFSSERGSISGGNLFIENL